MFMPYSNLADENQDLLIRGSSQDKILSKTIMPAYPKRNPNISF
jgi:hypothetical protein